MRFATKLAAVAVAAAAAALPGAASASATTAVLATTSASTNAGVQKDATPAVQTVHKVSFCNKRGSNFTYKAFFSRPDHWSTYVVDSGRCVSKRLDKGEPYSIRVSNGSQHRWVRGRKVSSCLGHERVTLAGAYAYGKLKVTKRCL